MTPIKLTDNEREVLNAMARVAFNYDNPLDEKADNAACAELTELAAECGKSIPSVRGTVGNLTKKGILCEFMGGESGITKMIGVTDEGIDAYYWSAPATDPATTDPEAIAAVETFYDANPEVRSWTILVKDGNGNQVGAAQYAAQRAEAQKIAEQEARSADLTGYVLFNTKGKVVTYTFKTGGKISKAVA